MEQPGHLPALALAIAAGFDRPDRVRRRRWFPDYAPDRREPGRLPDPSGPGQLRPGADPGALLGQVFNSALIALTTTFSVVVLGVSAAFVLARYQFRGREGLYTFFTLGLLFPAGAAILPLYLMLRDLNLVNSYFAVILPQVAFSLPRDHRDPASLPRRHSG